MENARLISEEQMAKESNRLKSQFLAHVSNLFLPMTYIKRPQMSHEIRTPIAVSRVALILLTVS